jgi:hypothetical protein
MPLKISSADFSFNIFSLKKFNKPEIEIDSEENYSLYIPIIQLPVFPEPVSIHWLCYIVAS